MEVKKINKTTIIVLLIVFFPLSLFFFSDNTQYKQIGETHFYLMSDPMGDGSLLYHDGGIDGLFYPIHHKGFVNDVYWNHQYIIIKSSE